MKQIFAIFGFLSLILLQGCEKNTDIAPSKIKIISVSPATLLEDGVEYNFSVKVEYDLLTTSLGRIVIGFNTFDDISKISISSELIVVRGSGIHTFEVRTRAKDWKSVGDFKAWAGLYGKPNSYEPVLAIDRMILSFKN